MLLVVLMFHDLVEFVVTASAAGDGPAAGSRDASVARSVRASPAASPGASRTASHAGVVVGSVPASDQQQSSSGPSVYYNDECS